MARNKLYVSIFLPILLLFVIVAAFSKTPIDSVIFNEQQKITNSNFSLDSVRRVNDRILIRIEEKTKNYGLKDYSK